MGVNIHIVDLDGGKTPPWDYMRQGEDAYFARLLSNGDFPSETFKSPKDQEGYYDLYYRPANFDFWDTIIKVSSLEPKSRYYALLNILFKNPNVWIYLSF
jgi:hypothetical protein